jgi:hypothetical protein
MGWEMPELVELTRPVGKKRKKSLCGKESEGLRLEILEAR